MISDEVLLAAANSSDTLADTLRAIGKSPCGASYKTYRRRLEKLGFDFSKFDTFAKNRRGGSENNKKPIEDYLIVYEDRGSIHFCRIKHRLFEEGLKEKKCERCGIEDWLGEELTFEMDHINGNRLDCRFENLKILCPNCHTQTPTHSKQKTVALL